MKKLFAILLAVMMIAALAVPAMADGGYTITIGNPATGETYTAYKLMDATYEGEDVALANDDAVAYYYEGSAADPLYVILAKYFQFDAFVNGKAYVKVVDARGTKIDYSNVDVAAMAKEINDAVAAGTLTLTAAGSGNPTISVAKKGYYFVDTTLGSFCSIDTAAKVTIYEKNSIPTLTKEVEEDSTGAWGASAQGDHGQTMNFRLTVNTGTETHNPANPAANGVDADYVITDTLPAGMTYMDDAAIQGWTKNTDFTVAYANDVLTITLKAAKLATLGQNANIVITYGARIDTDAVVAGDGNKNEATLAYKEQTTEKAIATVYTYKFDILKEDGTTKKALENVEFTLTKTESVEVPAEEPGGEASTSNVTYYYVPSADNSSNWQTGENTLKTDKNGKITFTGLDAGTYTLTETKTLNGYNLLDAPITVVIAEDGTVTASGYADGVITVDNYAGSTLPSTGGMGTTLFYVIGGIMVMAAGVILVTKARVRKEEN